MGTRRCPATELPYVALRGDWKRFGISFLIQFLGGLFTFGIVSLVWCCVMGAKYNEWFVEGLVDKGYARVTEAQYWAIPGAPVVEAS